MCKGLSVVANIRLVTSNNETQKQNNIITRTTGLNTNTTTATATKTTTTIKTATFIVKTINETS